MLIHGKKLAGMVEAMGVNGSGNYDLDVLFIDTDATIYASNGCSIYWTFPETNEIEFPEMNETPYDVCLPILIPGQSVKKAVNNIPKRTSSYALQSVAICSPANNTKITLTTTDLDTTDNVISNRKDEGCYPSVESIIHMERKNEVFVSLSLNELDRLMKVAKKMGLSKEGVIRIGVINEYSPVSISLSENDQTINGLIMPMSK